MPNNLSGLSRRQIEAQEAERLNRAMNGALGAISLVLIIALALGSLAMTLFSPIFE